MQAMLASAARAPESLALYVHLPWCVRKCPYCDFNSHRAPGALPVADYVRALAADLDHDLATWPELALRPVTSVFFGGGTPSLFPPSAIADILAHAGRRLALSGDAEITLEANPGTTEHGRFEGYRQAGVNRISLGVQSFDDRLLRRLGRIHGAAEARAAAGSVAAAGFDRCNLDLMYALPGQDLAGALADLDAALALAPGHVSHYQLTLEPNTAFAAQPPPGLPDDDLAAAMMEACQARLADAGYGHYETSAYALPGQACRHNLNYWRYGDFLGIGAGAHGKLTVAGQVRRRWKLRHPRAFMDAAGGAAAVGGDQALAAADLPFDFLLNALRLAEGVPAGLFEARTGLPLAAIAPALGRARQRGLLADDPDRLVATGLGQRFLNDLLTLFLPASRR